MLCEVLVASEALRGWGKGLLGADCTTGSQARLQIGCIAQRSNRPIYDILRHERALYIYRATFSWHVPACLDLPRALRGAGT